MAFILRNALFTSVRGRLISTTGKYIYKTLSKPQLSVDNQLLYTLDTILLDLRDNKNGD